MINKHSLNVSCFYLYIIHPWFMVTLFRSIHTFHIRKKDLTVWPPTCGPEILWCTVTWLLRGNSLHSTHVCPHNPCYYLDITLCIALSSYYSFIYFFVSFLWYDFWLVAAAYVYFVTFIFFFPPFIISFAFLYVYSLFGRGLCVSLPCLHCLHELIF